MTDSTIVREGQIFQGPLFSEPMRVLTVQRTGENLWKVGLVGLKTERFRSVALTPADLADLSVVTPESSYNGDAHLLRLGLQAYALGIAYEFDPYFGLSISRVDPLPHQLTAVYDHLLRLARVRFLLADDAGAGKTVMAGLLIRELKLRGLAERILVICPSNLAFQWQRELKEKFGETFLVLKGADLRAQFGVNQWMEQKQVISSLDLAKRDDILPGLRQVQWDLVIVDEAHRMSWTPPSKKTARYALGELLRDASDHLLMLTATPHKGDPESFRLFLQLLDRDAFADIRSISEAMGQRTAPFYLRRTKEAMVYFPERQADGSWQARKIFTKRIPKTVQFEMDEAEYNLYQAVTEFVKRQSRQAAADGDNPRARAVGFLMSLYQRRLASSTFALRRSLENRARRLQEILRKAQVVAETVPDIPDAEELEEMEETERERMEDLIATVTLARNPEVLQVEIADIQRLAEDALKVEQSGQEAKLAKLHQYLEDQGFFREPAQRLLIFTEFKDTLEYLVRCLESWGLRVGQIHGGMRPGSREEPGTRLHTEQQFREGHIQILVATEAAGEGINLQVCHILFNYDIPWNPNRLEQRMGRIHRYGQTEDCLIFNFVADDTIEGRVLQRLLEKLQEIRNALDDDAVFNVVGEVLPVNQVERVLRQYYAGELGDADLEERLLQNVDEERFRAICQNALEGLATKNLNLDMLIERRAQAQERRVVPESIMRFILAAAEPANLSVKPVTSLPHTFDIGRTPPGLRRYEAETTWRLPPLAGRYPRCTTDRKVAEEQRLEWVTPGHPLFEALRRNALDAAQQSFAGGGCYYSLQHESPTRVDFYRASVVDGLGQVVRVRLLAVEFDGEGEPQLREPTFLGNFTPATVEDVAESYLHLAAAPEPLDWLNHQVLMPFLGEIRRERRAEIERVSAHVELSLGELLFKTDNEIGAAMLEIESGIQGAEGRLAQAENRHAELQMRRERRRQELKQQQALTLQDVERITTVLVLPHPEREAPEVRHLRPNFETEAKAMGAAIAHEQAQGRQVFDVHEKNLGYDITSLDINSGELRLIEVKGLAAATGTILLTPNERRVAEDRRDCYWLYIVTNCAETPQLQEPIKDPARFAWREVVKVQHYWMEVNAMTQPMTLREQIANYGT
jgi:superfamily II DNA or RNA helicase